MKKFEIPRKKLTVEFLALWRDAQLEEWELAKQNYDALLHAERRGLNVGNFGVYLQCNPARKVSTGANLDSISLQKRPCFLCTANRPEQQWVIPWGDWEILVNPFPILPFHFTVACKKHFPQDHVPYEIVNLAAQLPGVAVFFNGAKAGASAPDHLHMQMVLAEELPLLVQIENRGIANLPFKVDHYIIKDDQRGMEDMKRFFEKCNAPTSSGHSEADNCNAFAWVGNGGELHLSRIPRRAHRPSCYSTKVGEGRMVSPGAIDMCGLVILPRHEDFKSINPEEIIEIYSQTAYESC